MLVLPIRILACLLVVGVSVAHHGNADEHRQECVLNGPANYTVRNNIPQQCVCEGDKKSNKVVVCRTIGCVISSAFYLPGTKHKGCICKKGTNPTEPEVVTLYHWFCDGCKDGSISYQLHQKWEVIKKGIPSRCKCTRTRAGKSVVKCMEIGCRDKGKLHAPNTVLGKCRCVSDDRAYIWNCS